MRLRRRLAALLAVPALAAPLAVATAGPAAAAGAVQVYVHIKDSHCTQGGYVSNVLGMNVLPGGGGVVGPTPTGWAGAKVQAISGQTNTATASFYCVKPATWYRPWSITYIQSLYPWNNANFKPTANYQWFDV